MLEDAQPSSSCPPTPTKKKKKKNIQKKEINLFSHMGSVYSVTRRQQHLEGKCSSQLRDLQAGVKKKSGWTNIEQMTKDLQNDR